MSRSFQSVKPRFWVIVSVFTILVMAILYISQQRYIDRQNEQIAQLEAERDRLIAEADELQSKIDFTYTDQYIEREARKMGLIREDETLYQSNDINTAGN